MKKLLPLLLIVIMQMQAFAFTDVIDDMINTYENEEGVKIIDISPAMFGLISEGDDDIDGIMNNINSIKIISIDASQVDIKPLEYFKKIMKLISKDNFESLMSINEKDNKVKFMIRKNKDNFVSDFIMLIGNLDEFKCIYINGLINLNDVSKLSENMNIVPQNPTATPGNTLINNSGNSVRTTRSTIKSDDSSKVITAPPKK